MYLQLEEIPKLVKPVIFYGYIKWVTDQDLPGGQVMKDAYVLKRRITKSSLIKGKYSLTPFP